LLPLRVVVDSHWRTSPDSKLLNDPTKVLIVGSKTEAVPEALAATGVECLCLDPRADRVDLANLMARLADRQINEIQVEAGPTLCGSLLREQLVDEVLWYQAPILLGDGATGPFQLGPLESMKERTHLELQESIYLGRDLRLNFRPVYRTGAAS